MRQKSVLQEILDCASLGFQSGFFVMPITKKPSQDSVELFVSGRIDGALANDLEVTLLETMRGGTKTIYVNLSEATFLCSAGLRVLLQHWRQMKNAGKVLWLANPSAEVDSVLTMTGFRAQMVEGAQPPA
jgi:anti-anti-sigma factor